MELKFSKFNLSLKSRFVVVAFLYILASILQWWFDSSFFKFAGFFLMVIGLPFLAVKSFSGKPNDQGFENWRAVSMKEINRILKNSNAIKKVSIPPVYYKFSIISVLVFFGIFAFSIFIQSFSGSFLFVLVDLILCFIPFLFFASISKWRPKSMIKKINLMEPIFNATLPTRAKLIPFIRFDEDENKLPIPEDVKFSYEIPSVKDELNMIQFQLAWNDGPNGKVPYLYAVYLFSKKANFYERVKATKSSKFIIEDSAQKDKNSEFHALVVRQKTSDGGYFTDEKDRHKLVDFVIETLR